MYDVKQVCKETGLTRKLLHDYDVQGIVKPSGYKNYNVDRTGGYKLYDQDAFIKLKQIAIYRELHMKRGDIKRIICSPDYDCNRILDEQLVLLQKKREEIEQLIAAVEQLQVIGIKNRALDFLQGSSLIQLAQASQRLVSSFYYQKLLKSIEDVEFVSAAAIAIEKLMQLDDEVSTSSQVTEYIKPIVRDMVEHFGLIGYLFLFIIAISTMGDGKLAQELQTAEACLTPTQADAILTYVEQDIDTWWSEVKRIIAKHRKAIGADLDSPSVKKLVDAVKDICKEHFGMKRNSDYTLMFELIPIEFCNERSSFSYILNATRYYCTQNPDTDKEETYE